MTIEVLYFAIARERAGCGGEEVELPDGSTLDDLCRALTARHPAFDGLWAHMRLAVDEAFVSDRSTPLTSGSTVALIPPVSGG